MSSFEWFCSSHDCFDDGPLQKGKRKQLRGSFPWLLAAHPIRHVYTWQTETIYFDTKFDDNWSQPDPNFFDYFISLLGNISPPFKLASLKRRKSKHQSHHLRWSHQSSLAIMEMMIIHVEFPVTERIMQSHLIVLGGVSRTHSNPFTGDEDEVVDNTNHVYATLRTVRGSYFSPRQKKVSGLVSYLLPYKRNTHLL